MKTIKNISIIAVLAFAGLSSCSKAPATNPSAVGNSIAQPTPTALTDLTGTKESGGENQNGNQHEDGTVIDSATLPQLVKDYLSTIYTAATIIEARSMADGSFEVELSTGIEAIFGANGSFVKTKYGSSED